MSDDQPQADEGLRLKLKGACDRYHRYPSDWIAVHLGAIAGLEWAAERLESIGADAAAADLREQAHRLESWK